MAIREQFDQEARPGVCTNHPAHLQPVVVVTIVGPIDTRKIIFPSPDRKIPDIPMERRYCCWECLQKYEEAYR